MNMKRQIGLKRNRILSRRRLIIAWGMFCLLGGTCFAAGELQWQERTEGIPDWITTKAEFTMFTVPEKHGTANGNKVQLAVARAKAVSPKGNPPIVYLAGGPGGSAISAANAGYTKALLQKLHKHHDLVFMDQRGTGRSKPSLRFPSETGLPDRFFADAEVARDYFRQLQRKAMEHFKGEGVDFTAYNSVESADDLEALRKALGEEKLILLGFSYGTHLGLTMLKRHPESVEKAVLVGCEGLDQTLKLPSTYNAQLSKLAYLAATDPDIGKAVPDLEGLTARVLAKLEKKPVMVPIANRNGETLKTIPVGKSGLQLILRMDIGDGNDFPDFPGLLHALDKGDISRLIPYVTKRYFQLGRGINVMSTVMDLSSGVSEERWARIQREVPDCFLGRFVNINAETNSGLYPGIDLGESFRKPFYCNIPTMFVSGQMDSNTPPFQAEQLRWRFSRGAHVILEYGGHEDMLPHPEIQKLASDFISGKEVRDQMIHQPRPKFRPLN